MGGCQIGPTGTPSRLESMFAHMKVRTDHSYTMGRCYDRKGKTTALYNDGRCLKRIRDGIGTAIPGSGWADTQGRIFEISC